MYCPIPTSNPMPSFSNSLKMATLPAEELAGMSQLEVLDLRCTFRVSRLHDGINQLHTMQHR